MDRPRHRLPYALLFVSTVLLYALLFLILPHFFPRLYPQSNEASAVLLILTFLFSSAGVLLLELRLWNWIVADLLFGLLLLLYDGKGLYGIGLRGVLLDGARPAYHKALAAAMIVGLLLGMVLLQGLSLLLKRLLKTQR